MQEKTLPDTNAILRYLLRDDEALYKKSANFFEKVRTGEEKAIIIEGVLVESVYVLKKFYVIEEETVAEKMIGLLHYKGIINDDKKELIEALNIYEDKKIDIVDCILCAKSKSYNMKLFSFDRDLKKCHS